MDHLSRLHEQFAIHHYCCRPRRNSGLTSPLTESGPTQVTDRLAADHATMANPDIDDFDFPPAHAEDILSFANILGAADEAQRSYPPREALADGLHDHLSIASHRSSLGEAAHDASFPDLQLSDEATFAHLFPPPPDLVYSNTSSGHSPASTGSWGMSHDSPPDPAYTGNSINGDYEGEEQQDLGFRQGNQFMTKNVDLDRVLHHTITEADVASLFAGPSFQQPASVVPLNIGNSYPGHEGTRSVMNMHGSVGVPARGQSFTAEGAVSMIGPPDGGDTLGADSNGFAWNAYQDWSGLPGVLVDPPPFSAHNAIDYNITSATGIPAGSFGVDVADINMSNGSLGWNNIFTGRWIGASINKIRH